MKILFQGDSITDYGRGYEDPHVLGTSYPAIVASELPKKHPDIDFEFVNLSIGGNTTGDLLSRMQADFIDVQPDIVSILVGINDTWSRAAKRDWLDDYTFEANYRALLKGIKDNTHAKIMMIEHYILPTDDKLYYREDIYRKIEIERKLAHEYADVYVPLDGLLNACLTDYDSLDLTCEGVHPTPLGIQKIAEFYLQYIEKLL